MLKDDIIFHMALDNSTIDIIVNQMKKELVGATLGKPLSLGGFAYGYPYSEVLSDGKIRHGTFVFSLDSASPFISLSRDRYEKIDDNTPFYNSLRKLTMATITSVKKLKGERVIVFSLKSNPNDLSEINTGYDFILELFPNRPNCYLIAYPYGRIVSLYKERTLIEKGIFVARNTPYVYPKERETLPNTLENVEDAKKYVNNGLYRHIVQYIEQGKGSFEEVLTSINNSESIYLYGKELLPYSFKLEEAKEISVFDIYSSFVMDQKKLAKMNKEKELMALIDKAIKVNEKKIEHLKRDQKEAEEHMVFMEYGQMIYLYQGEIKKGDTKLERDGYSIPLDPLLNAPNNANRYFKRYSKAKAAKTILADLIVKAQDENTYLKKKQMEARDGTPRDIMELKSELLQQGYIKEKQTRGHINKVSKRKTYQPHYLTLEDGKIGFGMNGLQNEELTFNVASKENLFFHVKDYPGSHVVILEGEDKENIFTMACELALYLSHLDNGEVMIARRKNVKKNPNKLGLVSILKYETVAVKYIRPTSLSLFKKALKTE